MIAIAVIVIVISVAAFLFVSAPGFIGGPMIDPPIWSYALPVLAVVGPIVGLVWMVRIYRADPEPDQGAWRYRAKR